MVSKRGIKAYPPMMVARATTSFLQLTVFRATGVRVWQGTATKHWEVRLLLSVAPSEIRSRIQTT